MYRLLENVLAKNSQLVLVLGMLTIMAACNTLLQPNMQNANNNEPAAFDIKEPSPPKPSIPQSSKKYYDYCRGRKDKTWIQRCTKAASTPPSLPISTPSASPIEKICRIGMTTRESRKEEWIRDYGCIGVEVVKLETLADCVPSKRAAQDCENVLAKKHNCESKGGGRPPISPFHFIYKFECRENGKPTACIPDPMDRFCNLCCDKNKTPKCNAGNSHRVCEACKKSPSNGVYKKCCDRCDNK